MSERLPGVPKGFRLKGFFGYPYLTPKDYVLWYGTAVQFSSSVIPPTNNLLPVLERIEKPKQYEFVLVIPADGIAPESLESTAAAIGAAFLKDGGTVRVREKRNPS